MLKRFDAILSYGLDSLVKKTLVVRNWYRRAWSIAASVRGHCVADSVFALDGGEGFLDLFRACSNAEDVVRVSESKWSIAVSVRDHYFVALVFELLLRWMEWISYPY